MSPSPHEAPRSSAAARLLGWFVAVNALSILAALVLQSSAAEGASGAARQVAIWCGLG
jgi:hypothetical protein